jgi:hypothetical protein
MHRCQDRERKGRSLTGTARGLAATARASSAGAISESGNTAWKGSAAGPTGEDSWVAGVAKLGW